MSAADPRGAPDVPDAEASGLVVAFKGSCRARLGEYAPMVDRFWADQPTPPSRIGDRYADPACPWMTWPPLANPGPTPQQRRLEQALYAFSPSITLDPVKSTFTYTRLTLAGTWTPGPPPANRFRASRTEDVVAIVTDVLRWTLKTLYGMPKPTGYQAVMPLSGLSVSFRELCPGP